MDIKNINQWFIDRDMHMLDGEGQLKKLKEEVTELLEARKAQDVHEEKDAIGDIAIVLMGYCLQRGYVFEECIEQAYQTIKHRTGKVIDGVYVKDETECKECQI